MKGPVSWGELVRFGLVGAVNTLLTYAVYVGLVFLGFHYVLALVVDYVVAIVFSLVANKWFTFQHPGPITRAMVVRMVLTYGSLWVMNTVLLWVLVDGLQAGPYFSQAAVTMVIALCSFLLQRFAVFRRSDRDPSEPRP